MQPTPSLPASSYDQLTHQLLPYPKSDSTFNPINNAWKLQQIVGTASASVRVSISVELGLGRAVEGQPTWVTFRFCPTEAFVDGYPAARISTRNIGCRTIIPKFSAPIKIRAQPDKLLTTALFLIGMTMARES
jgi:hypothetical protein